MKKIAVACDNGLISEHFGHCGEFALFDTENGNIINEEIVQSPGHGHGALPVFLQELGVSVIISGGMGSGAAESFTEKKIEIFTGASGLPKTAVEAYLAGKLMSVGITCSGHGHEHGHQN